jgi:hypothetical protein
MAYKWDDKGSIIGDGLPDGVRINVNQYQSVAQQYADSKKRPFGSFYPSMNSDIRDTKLSDSITKFVYRNGKVQGFLPELEQSRNQFNIGRNSDYVPVQPRNLIGGLTTGNAPGFYVDVDGIAFDPATKSGDIPDGAEVSFSSDQGSTLATFKTGSEVNGYMRLATQQAKAADNLRLGNQSGTLDSSVRQNAQRRTLL